MASTTQPEMAARFADVPRLLALVVGAVFTLVGIVGFGVTGFDDFASHEGDSLLGFHLNPLHNLVHIAIGVVGLSLAWKGMARLFGWLLFIGYGVTFIYGLFAVGNDDINFLALNAADNGLHAASALVGLLIALWPNRSTAQQS